MPSSSSPLLASIVVPTRMRSDYLRIALASIAPQAAAVAAELIVIDDGGPSEHDRRLTERFGGRYEAHPQPLGLNVARNTGVERSGGELVVFVDDDVEVCEGWLVALLAAARAHTDVEVFTGPIVPRLEGHPPRSCGREGPPITSLDLGAHDTPARFAWGANMAIRRCALERVGPFDTTLEHGGDEQEWQERLRSTDRALGKSTAILYVAHAKLHHRRSPEDASLLPLCRAGRVRGEAARRFDAWREEAPSIVHELRTLTGCISHVIRRRCPAGLVMVAHSIGRLRQALRARRHGTHGIGKHPAEGRDDDDFLSGESGTVGGLHGLLRAGLDLGTDTLQALSGQPRRLKHAAKRSPARRRVLVLGVERPEHRGLAQGVREEFGRSRHHVELYTSSTGKRGKFENLNLLLDLHPPHDYDWLFVVDDDIVLPGGFLDDFLFLAERFDLDLAQPAHRHASHAAWRVTRRRLKSSTRETSFVEIGPVTAFARSTFSELLPFPELQMGWGLDLHWAAIAREHGWRCGVIDAVPIAHRVAPAASAYSREQALAEARTFLARRPYLKAEEAQRTLTTHRRW